MLWKIFLSAAALLLLNGCALFVESVELPPVKHFELPRYLGVWHEIARLPNPYEKGMTHVTAEYLLRPDGRLLIRNCGMKDGERHCAEAVGDPAGAPEQGLLRISYFRPFYGEYRIIRLNDAYTTAVVTGSRMNRLWILARTPEIPKAEFQQIIAWLTAHGFDLSELESGQIPSSGPVNEEKGKDSR